MDLRTLAGQLAGNASTGQIRRRQGLIQAINSDGTLDITIGGSDVVVENVAAFDHLNPRVGASCFLDTDGRDLMVVGMIASAVTGFASCAVGEVREYPKSISRPGWLYCDGTVYNIADHPDLGAYLGATFGGNGTTTFAVPDLRGIFLRGYGTHGTLTDAVSSAVGTYQADENAAHVHEINLGTGALSGAYVSGRNWSSSAGSQNTVASGGTEARPNNTAVYRYIKS